MTISTTSPLVPQPSFSAQSHEGLTALNQSGFFSAIPRAVWDLRASGELTARDVDVLGLLLDYKNRRSSIVEPRQETLAIRLRCSVDTIQRSLARLEGAGLLARARRRDRQGRLGRCVYDLAALLSLMPRQAAALRSGQWGAADAEKSDYAAPRGAKQKDVGAEQSEVQAAGDVKEKAVEPEDEQPENPAGSMPQPCGFREADSEIVQADNTAAPPRASVAPACPVVCSLTSQGLAPSFAARLVSRFGLARCRQVLRAALKIRQVHSSRAGWIVRCLHEEWKIPTEGASLPVSHQPYRGPHGNSGPLPAANSAFATLTDEERMRLEEIARRALREEANPLVLAQLNKGRGQAFVRLKITELAAQKDGGDPSKKVFP